MSTSRLIKFSGGEGRGGDSSEVECPGLLLPVGVDPVRELLAVGGWEDGGCLCRPLLRLPLLRLPLLFG